VTQKLRASMSTYCKDTAADIDRLFENQRVLKDGEEKIERAVSHLKQEQVKFSHALVQLQQKSADVRTWLEENEDGGPVDVDQIVYCKDTWSQQIVEAVADDHAIEDTLYVLDRALQDGRIDLQTFLKETRNLARKQFFARALAAKILEKQQQQQQSEMGLAVGVPGMPGGLGVGVVGVVSMPGALPMRNAMMHSGSGSDILAAYGSGRGGAMAVDHGGV